VQKAPKSPSEEFDEQSQKHKENDAAKPLETLPTVGNLLGLNCYRDINSLPNALGYDAEILE